MGVRIASLEPLQQRGYRLLWLASLPWYCGRWMDILVAGWLALQLTNSVWDVALIGFYRSIPVPLFGIFAGAIADRVDRRLLVIATGVTNTLASLTVAGLLISGRLEYWHLAAANLLLGLAWSVDWPSRRAILPDLVSREQLLPAVVLDTMSGNVNKALGPIVGGAVVYALSIPGCYLLLAFIYAAGFLPIVALRLPRKKQAQAVPAFRFIAEGLRFCQKYQAVRGVLLITVIMNCFIFPYAQLLPVFAREVLQVGPVGLGLLMGSDGIGSVISTAILMGWTRLRRYGWVFVLGSLAMCGALIVFAASPVYVLSLIALVLGGIGHTGFSAFQSTIVLRTVGDALRGRVMGILALAIGSSPLGMLTMGAIAATLSAPWAVGLTSALGAILIAGTAAMTPGLLALQARPDRRAAPVAADQPAARL
ncbi:MAG: MFS transporter [Chloroflexi bacterium]|nr:MFS transporter [Chloroflexota bacterium]